jgi:hypothetical protein
MLERDINHHDGCPYRGHCKKNEEQCCYLVKKNKCYLDDNRVEFFV